MQISSAGKGTFSFSLKRKCWVLVAHTCNPSYSGGRDQYDCGSKPAQANSLAYLKIKTTITKKGLVEWLKV
jgi:hypothetical protein